MMIFMPSLKIAPCVTSGCVPTLRSNTYAPHDMLLLAGQSQHMIAASVGSDDHAAWHAFLIGTKNTTKYEAPSQVPRIIQVLRRSVSPHRRRLVART
ncbi:hypothetical protein [Neobacillus fumarioli]|uniref:hypothetical protein n=1 Tax=Neobacillus fumarioli TaxID=105229 RepID=UPI000AAE583E|nr:hypothetical protein [Neobacillus fumarioli]